MDDSTITFLVLGATVVLFVLDKLPVALVALGVALSLWATGVLDLSQAFAGFSDPAVILIASLFVVSEGLEASGVTAWIGQELLARVGESRTRLIVLMLALVAVLDRADQRQRRRSPRSSRWRSCLAIRTGRPPSQLMMPLAFGAHAGSLLALTGTPVNVIVSEAAGEAGVGQFGYFEFALVGLPLVVGVILIVLLLRRAAAADA